MGVEGMSLGLRIIRRIGLRKSDDKSNVFAGFKRCDTVDLKLSRWVAGSLRKPGASGLCRACSVVMSLLVTAALHYNFKLLTK